MSAPDLWRLTSNGRHHEVAVTERGLGHRVAWTVDGEPIDSRWTMDERLVLVTDKFGAVGLHFTTLGRTRRVSWFDVDSETAARAANQIPLSGKDFEPEAGSAAARRIEWMRAHPRLYTVRSAAIAAGGVLLGIVAVSLLAQLVVRIPWPDWRLPDVPWPQWRLPSLPWPDLPFPRWDLPDWALPPWVAAIASALKYVIPVVIAAGIAYAEVRRRRPASSAGSTPSVGPTQSVGPAPSIGPTPSVGPAPAVGPTPSIGPAPSADSDRSADAASAADTTPEADSSRPPDDSRPSPDS